MHGLQIELRFAAVRAIHVVTQRVIRARQVLECHLQVTAIRSRILHSPVEVLRFLRKRIRFARVAAAAVPTAVVAGKRRRVVVEPIRGSREITVR